MRSAFCPICQEPAGDPAAKKCDNCGAPLDATAAVHSVAGSVRRNKIAVRLDLAVTDDRTGSSRQFEDGIPKMFEIIMKHVAAKAQDVRVWLQTHGDKDEGQHEVLLTDGGTPEQALQDLRGVTYGGGGAPQENHLDAIEHLMNTVPWNADRTVSRGAVLAFMTADSKPARSGTSARELGEGLRKRGLLLYLVCQPTPTLVELVRASGGLLFPITNAPDPKELEKIAVQMAASIVVTASSGATMPMTAIAPAAVVGSTP